MAEVWQNTTRGSSSAFCSVLTDSWSLQKRYGNCSRFAVAAQLPEVPPSAEIHNQPPAMTSTSMSAPSMGRGNLVLVEYIDRPCRSKWRVHFHRKASNFNHCPSDQLSRERNNAGFWHTHS